MNELELEYDDCADGLAYWQFINIPAGKGGSCYYLNVQCIDELTFDVYFSLGADKITVEEFAKVSGVSSEYLEKMLKQKKEYCKKMDFDELDEVFGTRLESLYGRSKR